jgi:elongation factor Tu
MIISKPGVLKVWRLVEAQLYILTEEEGGRKTSFMTNYKPIVYWRTADFAATITLPENVKMASPGDTLLVRMKLEFPIPVNQNEKFAIREGGKTIAGGVFTQMFPDDAASIKEMEERFSKQKAKGKK